MANLVVFSVALRKAEWDPRKSGWSCEALRIPGDRVERIFAEGGGEADSAAYQVDAGLHLIRWINQPPKEVLVVIRLDQPLVTEAEKLKWQKIAIGVGLAAVIVGVFLKAVLDKHWVGTVAPLPVLTATPSPSLVVPPPSTPGPVGPPSAMPKRCPPAPAPASPSEEALHFVELARVRLFDRGNGI